MKVKIMPHEEGPTAASIIYIFGYEGVYTEDNLSKYLPEILQLAELPANTHTYWRYTAGCECGCSPGFVLESQGYEIYVDL